MNNCKNSAVRKRRDEGNEGDKIWHSYEVHVRWFEGWETVGQAGGWARFSVTGWAHEGQRRAMKRENLCMLIRLKADLKPRFGADWKPSPA